MLDDKKKRAGRPECFVPRDTYNHIYQGVPAFLGLDAVKVPGETGAYDAAILGIPWEGPVTWGGPSGCELSPKKIREASIRYGGFLPEFNYDLFDHLDVCDCGDVPVVPGDNEAVRRNIRESVSGLLEQNTVPVILGGDHTITFPAVEALARKHPGRVGLVHLDAHLDNMEGYGDEKLARCCPLHRIYEDENMDPAKIIHMGIRGPRSNPNQMRYAKEVGAHVLTGFEIKQKGIEYALAKALEVVADDTDAVYVTVCSDILDVAFNPGGPPDLNGLSSFELSSLLYGLAATGIAAFDFVEIYPFSDSNNISAHTAAWMAIYVLSGLARHRMETGIKAD